MFDAKYVATAMSVACVVNWLCNFAVGLGFPYLQVCNRASVCTSAYEYMHKSVFAYVSKCVVHAHTCMHAYTECKHEHKYSSFVQYFSYTTGVAT